mgnify:CR=1 FL=1
MHYLTPVRKDFRYFIKRYIGDLSNDENIVKMFDLIFSSEKKKGIAEGFWTFDLNVNKDKILKDILIKKVTESDRSLKSIFKIIIEEYVSYKNKTRCCIKFPVYLNYVPKLIEWYPDCRIVHIIRDPRAMSVSRKNDPRGTREKIKRYPYLAYFIKKFMVLFVVFQYIWTSRLHITLKKLKNYNFFKYEDLLFDPESTIKTLCEHTGIEFSANMLKPSKGQPSSITEQKHEGFDKNAAFRWRKHITPFENKMITFLTSSSMRRFDYNSNDYLDDNISS